MVSLAEAAANAYHQHLEAEAAKAAKERKEVECKLLDATKQALSRDADGVEVYPAQVRIIAGYEQPLAGCDGQMFGFGVDGAIYLHRLCRECETYRPCARISALHDLGAYYHQWNPQARFCCSECEEKKEK